MAEKEKKLTPEQEAVEKAYQVAKKNLDDGGLKSAYWTQMIKTSPYAGIHSGNANAMYNEALDDDKKYKSLSDKIIKPGLKGGIGVHNEYIQQTSFQIYLESLGRIKVSDLAKRYGYKGEINEKLKDAFVGEITKGPEKNPLKNPLIQIALQYDTEQAAIEMSKQNQKSLSGSLEEILKPEEKEEASK